MPYGILNLVIDSGNSFPPVRCQANTRGSIDFLSVWTLGYELQWSMNQNTNIFIQENVVEIVCKKAAILFVVQCVKSQLEPPDVIASLLTTSIFSKSDFIS